MWRKRREEVEEKRKLILCASNPSPFSRDQSSCRTESERRHKSSNDFDEIDRQIGTATFTRHNIKFPKRLDQHSMVLLSNQTCVGGFDIPPQRIRIEIGKKNKINGPQT